MERLTEKNDETYFYPHCFEECDGAHETCSECEFDEKVCMRIGKYEDTGLAPEQIMDLKERDTAMEINEIHVDEYYCPACGSENNCDQGVVEDNFCPRCGQRLK